MDENQAREIAQRYLVEQPAGPAPLALFDDAPDDHVWCYLFFWNTAAYVQTGDMAYSVGPGTGPIAVVKATGEAWALGSASFDAQLAAYARAHGIRIG